MGRLMDQMAELARHRGYYISSVVLIVFPHKPLRELEAEAGVIGELWI